ncbi:MAG: hypothetical protein AVDCRST_MAG68-5712 [uncultured Gemmatimonadetes bacterium]|uniref:Uncharacterized protein n=1 Tax=uncultured Gemmatimonadota bacterium TaxID=203437 RepID=A0A6J4MZI9_9BACT|nr:MAG: hypothetical protein AVDCRST_MAG68-5712 [uncultured Gemmatimonadota bacterium]
MAKDNTRDGTQPLGDRAGALLGRVTPEEVERARSDAEKSEPEVDALARAAAEKAMRQRPKGKGD